MTRRETHEMTVAINHILMYNKLKPFPEDWTNSHLFVDTELINLYKKVYGSEKGFRKYVRNECLHFWTDCEPYLDAEYQDYEWIRVGSKIINLDDLWMEIKGCLEEELKEKQKEDDEELDKAMDKLAWANVR